MYSINGRYYQNTPLFEDLKVRRYTAYICDNHWCTAQTVFEIFPQQQPLPSATFAYTTNGLTTAFANQSKNATEYLWDFGDSNYSNAVNPQHTYAQRGTYKVLLTAYNTTYQNTQYRFVKIHTTGIEHSDNQDNIVIYPNPTEDKVTIALPQSITGKIEVFDATGRCVFQSELHSAVFAVQLPSKGVYFVKIESNGTVVVRKVVRL